MGGHLQALLRNARCAKQIPFESIRDDGIMGGHQWFDLEMFLHREDSRREWYEADRQRDQDVRLEVWCDAAGMLPQLAKVADDYSVPVYSCGGFDSISAIRQIVDSVVARNRDTVVLHLGDYDPSGVCLFERIREDVSAFLAVDAPEYAFDCVRVALTEEQIQAYGLPMDGPINPKDPRSPKWIEEGKTEKAELETLAPDTIATIPSGEHRGVHGHGCARGSPRSRAPGGRRAEIRA